MNLTIVDKVYVLGLQKKEEKIRKYFNQIFPESKLLYFFTNGVGATQNDGQMQSSLWNILTHSTIDNVSMDIFSNHMKMIQEAYQSNYQNVLFLEDDARFPSWNQKQWQEIEIWLQNNQQVWDIFYLGYCNWPWIWSILKSKHVVQLYSPLAAHAYLLNRRGMERILSTLQKNPEWRKKHIDKFFCEVPNLQKHGAYPMMSFQETCPGLYLKACDKLHTRILFSTCCKWNENISILFPILFIFFLTFFTTHLIFKNLI